MVCSSSTWICRGVLENFRSNCVSVAILVGIKFKMSNFSGRMSWCMARYSVMTKIFSLSRVSLAGREFGILMGMGEPPDLAWRYTGVYAHGDTPIKSYFYGNGNLGFQFSLLPFVWIG